MVALLMFRLALLLALPAVLAEPTPFGLHGRQSAGDVGFIPSQTPDSCLQGVCKPLADIYAPGQCITFECLCTDKVVSAIRACVPCVVAANIPGWDQAVADRGIAGLIDACNNLGHSVSASTSSASPPSSSSSNGGGTTQTGGATTGMSLNVAGLLSAMALGGIALA